MSPGNPFKNLRNHHPIAWMKRNFGHPILKMKSFFTNAYAKFVVKRLIYYLVVLFFAISLVFFIIQAMPGDPVDVMMNHANRPIGVNPDDLARAMRAQLGLDRSILDQYLGYLGGFIRADFGASFTHYPTSVGSRIMYFLPFTLALAIPVLIISFLLGNWIGARAAYMKGKKNETAYFALVFCNQLPPFWFALVLIFLFVAITGTIPPIGATTLGTIPDLSFSYLWDVFTHWVLPFMTLIVVYLGAWATGMRSMVTHEMDAGYVRYGEQLGFKKNKLMSYTERNAILPQFTGLNLVFTGIIGNTTIIEIVFGWPGIGLLLFNAVNDLDYPMIFGCFMIIVMIIVVGNFLIDILYGFIDPRIRTGHG